MAADSDAGERPLASSMVPGAGDGQPGAARERGDQFCDIQRVARGPAGQLQQVVAGFAAGQGRYQLGHRLIGEPGELEPGPLPRRTPQCQQVFALRHRAHHPGQQERHLVHRPCQPRP